MARGTIQMEFQKNFETANHQFDFDFDTTYQMTPGFQVMVSYFEEDGELVADYCSCTLFKDMIHEVRRISVYFYESHAFLKKVYFLRVGPVFFET